jgi:hypothetical protein
MLSRRAALVAVMGAAGAAASGCAVTPPADPGAVIVPTTAATATPAPSPTPTVDLRPRAPLTGRLVSSATALNHAAVAVKVSNVASAHPQAGVNQADLVFVEPNGISYTRLCAVFHSRFPDLVGPVRSIRPVDVPLLSPMKPVFGNTAAANWVMHYVAAHKDNLESLYSFAPGIWHTDAYYTMPGRARVHSVFCHPDNLRKKAKHMKSPPAAPYLPFAVGEEVVSTELSGKGAEKVSIPWGPGDTWNTSYTYDDATKQYLRSEPWGKHILMDGHRVHCDNVLVVRAAWRMDKIFAGTGAADPVVDITHSGGTFYYLHHGTHVRGSWTKGGLTSLFTFQLEDGSPLRIAPGRTFMELPQIDAKVKVTG